MCQALEVETTPIKNLPVDRDAEAEWGGKSLKKQELIQISPHN